MRAAPSVDVLAELLFVLTILESVACLACTFMVVLIASRCANRYYLLVPLSMFVVAALALLLTAALADIYSRCRHHRAH
jgi:hypothetical protein